MTRERYERTREREDVYRGEALKEKIDDRLPYYVHGGADVFEACIDHPNQCIITNAKKGLGLARSKMQGVAREVAAKNGSTLIYGPEERVGQGEKGRMVRLVVKTDRGYQGTPVGDIQMGGDQRIEHVGYSYPIYFIPAMIN